MKIEHLNATFQPAKIGHPHGLQVTYLKDNSTRNIFIYHEDGKVGARPGRGAGAAPPGASGEPEAPGPPSVARGGAGRSSAGALVGTVGRAWGLFPGPSVCPFCRAGAGALEQASKPGRAGPPVRVFLLRSLGFSRSVESV